MPTFAERKIYKMAVRPVIEPEEFLADLLSLMDRDTDMVSFEGRRNRNEIIRRLRLLANHIEKAGRVPDIQTVLREFGITDD